jgi:pyruvate dehydrogenase E2 component (dihydrolipoamide acetyltransferase)
MATRIVMPRLGDFMTEGTIARWAKAPGERVQRGEVIAEIETEKLNYDLEATDSGVFHPAVAEGAAAPVDGVIGYLLAEGEAPPQAAGPSAAHGAAPRQAAAPSRLVAPAAGEEVVPSTPGARKLAAQLGVDISKVTPTGPRGRVVEADVRAYAEQQKAGAVAAPTAAQTPRPPPGLPEPSKVAPLKGMRKAIADNMRGSVASTAQLSFFIEVDVTEAMRLRRETSQASGVTISIAHVLMKACAEALRRNPELNTILRDGNVFYFDDVNIGLAVALDEGLIVPVVRQADKKGLLQITREASELAARARDGKLSPDEVVGGTFTISVLGTVDGFTPILNPGQSAILGAGRSVEKPVVRDGQVVAREMMTLSLTVDHQVIDGAVAASFLRRLQQMVERPAALFK